MNLHVTTGRWKLGLALSLITAFLWGVLPIALKVVLESMDAYSITWYRFLIATSILVVYVTRKNGLPSVKKLKGSVPYLLIAASVGLSGNYISYLLGLDYLSPSTATVVIQLAPIFMLVGSLIIFKERFSVWQWTGFTILLAGMALFFNDRFDELLHSMSDYTAGVLLIIVSGAIWAAYALSQKQLLRTFPSETIMLCVYSAGTLFFMPLARPSSLLHLDTVNLLLLVFCSFNTLLAYGSFAEALDHWEASRVSMVLAVIPIITLIGVKLCSTLFPGFVSPEHFNSLSLTGAFFVVAGCMLCALDRTTLVKAAER